MDKELLRVVIILIGVLVMIGMVLWHFFKSMRDRRADDYYGDESYERDDDFVVDEDEDIFDMAALGGVVDGDALLDDISIKPSSRQASGLQGSAKAEPKKSRSDLPKLIEFSIVARDDEGFNGEDLFEAFERVGLKYGSVKVFERVDRNKLVDFAVASMAGSGTFPDEGLDEFYCPGIVFFMQPRELDKPLAVFEDFMETIDQLADELNGVVWDNQRQPLTAETIEQFRLMLS